MKNYFKSIKNMWIKKKFDKKRKDDTYHVIFFTHPAFLYIYLTTKRLTPYSGRLCQALTKFILASSKFKSFTLVWDSRIFWRIYKYLMIKKINIVFLREVEVREPIYRNLRILISIVSLSSSLTI